MTVVTQSVFTIKEECFFLTHPNVVEDSLKFQWLVLPLHGGGV